MSTLLDLSNALRVFYGTSEVAQLFDGPTKIWPAPAVTVTAVTLTGNGQCWSSHSVSFTLNGVVITSPSQLPGAAVATISWRRNGVAIAGANAWTYTPVFLDDATTLTVNVSVTRGPGNTAAATSAGKAITNPERLLNGTFASTANWSIDNTAGSVALRWVIASGVAKYSNVDEVGGVSGRMQQALSGLSGQTFRVTYTTSAKAPAGSSGNLSARFTISNTAASGDNGAGVSANGVNTQDITLTSDKSWFSFYCTLGAGGAGTGTITVDNASVKRIA